MRIAPDTNLVLTQLGLEYTVDTATPFEAIEQAEKFTMWSWYDCMTAFREVGYDPTPQEEQRVKRALFIKKLKHILKDT